MRIISILLLGIIILFPILSASCDSDQVDINTASAEELDELYGIGPAKAEAIINSRPFESVNDLINVVGIGEITLNKIKDQNLACVNSSKEENEADEENEKEEEKESNKYIEEEKTEENTKITADIIKKDIKDIETIVLSPKDIKSENNTEQQDKNKLATYGLIIFSVLLVFLFRFRKIRKNEFE